jgi:hypothetical protein
VDLKTGVLLDVLPGSLSEGTTATQILNYDMHQKWGAVASFNPTDLEDLGTGKMLVKLDGRLLPGTYLRVGSKIVQPGSGGLPSDLKTTRFVADIADLATLKTFVISRDGTEYPLKIDSGGVNLFKVDRDHVSLTSLDDSTDLLRVPITSYNQNDDIPPVIVMGGKVFGYSDAPIDRECNPAAGTCRLSLSLPKDFVEANPVVTVKALMMDEDGGVQAMLAANRTFTLFPPSDAPEKLVPVTKDNASATYLVYGHELGQARIVWPTGSVDPACPPGQLCLQPVSPYSEDPSLRVLKLPASVAKDGSSIVMQRHGANDRPYVVSVPAFPTEAADSDASATDKASTPKFQESVVVGTNEATIVGKKLDSIKKVTYKDAELPIESATPTALRISGLAKTGATSVARTVEVVLEDEAKKQTKVKLEVVTGKIEVTNK